MYAAKPHVTDYYAAYVDTHCPVLVLVLVLVLVPVPVLVLVLAGCCQEQWQARRRAVRNRLRPQAAVEGFRPVRPIPLWPFVALHF